MLSLQALLGRFGVRLSANHSASDPPIHLVALGPVSEKVKLARIAHIANTAQSFYRFTYEPSPLHLGPPDAEGLYLFEKLVEVTRSFCTRIQTDCIIAITDAATEEELFSVVELENQTIFVFLHGNEIERILGRARVTHEGYVLAELAVQMLTREFRLRIDLHVPPSECGLPWHTETRSCLFDYCEIEEHTGKKLMTPSLCDSCKHLLRHNNIDQPFLDACMALFNAGLRPTFATQVRQLASNSVVSFIFGGVIGGLATSFIQDAVTLLLPTTQSRWTAVGLLGALLVLLFLVLRDRRANSLRF